jgi:phage tail-like protein
MTQRSALFTAVGPELESDQIVVGDAGVQLGRSGDNDVQLRSGEISRKHLRFDLQDRPAGLVVTVTDLNSSNGVHINETRIEPGVATALAVGDAVRAGPFTFTLASIIAPAPAQPAAPPPEPEPLRNADAVVSEPAEALDVQAEAPPAEEAHATTPPAALKDEAAAAASDEPVHVEPDAFVPVEPADSNSFVFTPLAPDAQDDKPAKAGKPAKPRASDEKDKPPVVEPPPAPAKAPPKAAPPPPSQPAASKALEEVIESVEKGDFKEAVEKATDFVREQLGDATPPREAPPAEGDTAYRDGRGQRLRSVGGNGFGRMVPGIPQPPGAPSLNGKHYPPGIPRDASNYLKYLPGIYSDDDFLGRFLLIFESIFSPVKWRIDNLDLWYTPETAPLEWVRWMASWFDLEIYPDLPEGRQRAILRQAPYLMFRRGTRAGVERLVELYTGVSPDIVEPKDKPGHFIVKLPLSDYETTFPRERLEALIRTHAPAFATFDLEIT